MTVVWTIVCFVFRQKRYELWCRKSDRLLSALGGRIDVAEQHRLGDGNHARTREMIRTERCGIPAGSSRYNDAHRGRHKSSPHGIHNRCNLCTIAWVGPLDQTSLTRRLKTNTRNTGRVLLSRSSDCFPPFQFWYLRCLFFFILFFPFGNTISTTLCFLSMGRGERSSFPRLKLWWCASLTDGPQKRSVLLQVTIGNKLAPCIAVPLNAAGSHRRITRNLDCIPPLRDNFWQFSKRVRFSWLNDRRGGENNLEERRPRE